MARDMVPEAEVFRGSTKNPSDIRAEWIAELRRQGHRQCVGKYRNQCGEVCALGLLRETALGVNFSMHMLESEIGALAGLSMDKSSSVVAMNDGDDGYHKHTFAEIADVVEGWFK